jgi:hypothetical protein
MDGSHPYRVASHDQKSHLCPFSPPIPQPDRYKHTSIAPQIILHFYSLIKYPAATHIPIPPNITSVQPSPIQQIKSRKLGSKDHTCHKPIANPPPTPARDTTITTNTLRLNINMLFQRTKLMSCFPGCFSRQIQCSQVGVVDAFGALCMATTWNTAVAS